MRFVRFREPCTDQETEQVRYGVYDNGKISCIEGSIFEQFTITEQQYAVEDVQLLYPCEPRNIYCVGLNFKRHIQELGLPTPVLPANFMKPVTGVVHPGEPIIYPAVAKRVDYEGEMALVIKHMIKDVTAEEAMEHILGVTPLNDVTEREMSYNSTQVTYSKSFDSFTSFGPIIDTELDPDRVTVRTYMNGKQVQEGNTSDFLFDCAAIVSYFSQSRTLYPGDIISTGTPHNVQPMHDGDIVEIELEGIPLTLKNPVYDPKLHR
ncbi:MAG: fumarylacetoacetate hydrolase family protein [Spirochaetia bacterium]|nr:fumarylacetoacetate hydrolase family protein [Spirochaetia bacterium]MCF7940596.1 fumarylacetoacetate hydrolase family protein [Spirochaetia bacterium]